MRLVPPMRIACDEDRRLAALDTPIPFSTVDPSGLVAMQEFLAERGSDVDEITLGEALNRYFEVTER